VSLIFASQVESYYQRGHDVAAATASKRAKLWCIVNVCVAAPIYLLVGVGLIVALAEQGGTISRSSEKESIQQIKALTRYQQAYFFENNRFTPDLSESNLATSEHYRYSAIVLDDRFVKITATPKASGRKSFTAAVVVGSQDDRTDFTMDEIICQSKQPTKKPPATPNRTDTGLDCAVGSRKVAE
jgi:hypothetical protein